MTQQLKDAVNKGATLHAGGTLHDGRGAPAVLTASPRRCAPTEEALWARWPVVYRLRAVMKS